MAPKSRNWIRLSEIPRNTDVAGTLPKLGTLHKWHHLRRYPQLFKRVGRAVFLDLGWQNEPEKKTPRWRRGVGQGTTNFEGTIA